MAIGVSTRRPITRRTQAAIVLSTGFALVVGFVIALIPQTTITCQTTEIDETADRPSSATLLRQLADDPLDQEQTLNRSIFAFADHAAFRSDATARKSSLRKLMRVDPSAAQQALLEPQTRRQVESATNNCVEKNIRTSGRLEVIQTDDIDHATTTYYLNDGRTSRPIFGLDETIRPGSMITVEGVTLDGDILVAALAPGVTPVNVTATPAGQQMVDLHRPLLVLLGDYTNTNVRWPDQPTLSSITTNMNAYYNENSYGRFQYEVTPTDWVETVLTRPTNCDVGSMLNALIAAHDATLDYQQFDGGDVAVVAPFPSTCRWGGMSEVVPRTFTTNDGVVQMTVAYVKTPTPTQANIEYVLTHELGHNLSGAGHANWAHCPNGQTLPNPSCPNVEYEDPYDVMGGWYNPTASEYRFGHFSADRKSSIGWIDPNQIVTMDNGDAERDVLLTPLEWSGGTKLLRIQRGQYEYLSIEFRQPVMADGVTQNRDGAMFQATFPNVFSGALVRYTTGGTATFLVDTSPAPNDPADVTLKVGESMTDPISGAVVSVVSQSATELRVHVTTPVIDYWPPPKSFEVVDGLGEDIDTTTDTTTVSAHWTPVIDLGSGLDYYAVTVEDPETALSTQINTGTATTVTFTDLNLPAGAMYYVVVYAVDRKGNISAPARSDGVYIDGAGPVTQTIGTTSPIPFPPTCVYAGSEFSEEISAGSSTTTMKMSWCPAPNESQVHHYAYAIGTTQGGTEVVPYTNIGMSYHTTRTGLSLINGGTYYVSVRSITSNGTAGSFLYSAPYVIDTIAPTAPVFVADGDGEDEDVTARGDRWQAHWAPVTDATTITYYYALSTTPGAHDVISPTSHNTTTLDLLDLDLAPGRYYTEILAMDAAGNTSGWAVSDGLVFDPNADSAAPIVTVTAPAADATVTGVTTLTAEASDDFRIESVQFMLDGVAIGSLKTLPPYRLVWNSSTVDEGSHIITAVASDGIHETVSSGVSITVVNPTAIPSTPPSVVLQSPITNTVVSGTVTFIAQSVTGRSGTFAINGLLMSAPVPYTNWYQRAWDTRTVANGTYFVEAFVYDQYGNEGTDRITLVVNNALPPDITAPSTTLDFNTL